MVSVWWNMQPYPFFCFCADADNVKLKLMKLLSLSSWLEQQDVKRQITVPVDYA